MYNHLDMVTVVRLVENGQSIWACAEGCFLLAGFFDILISCEAILGSP